MAELDWQIPKWRVKAVEIGPDYTLIITFWRGERRLFDFKPLLSKKNYQVLKNPGFFMKAHVGGDSVAWNDEVDIGPEYLYEKSLPLEDED